MHHIATFSSPALLSAIDTFLQIDDRSSIGPSRDGRRFNEVVAAVHGLCAALISEEQAGARRADIVRMLEPVRAIHGRSAFLARLQQWPRGYPGDFETIEYLWQGRNTAADRTSFYLEHYALTAPVAEQHRHKIRRQAQLMMNVLDRTGHIVNLACGSVPDLRLVAEIAPDKLASLRTGASSILLSDMDQAALDYAATALGPTARLCRFQAGHALRVLRKLDRPADLVLIGGLFDYLSERACAAIVRAAAERLADGGTLFFTNIGQGNPYRPWLEYCGEWTLIERTESDVRDLVDRCGVPMDVEVSRDTTGLTLLVTAVRRGGSLQ
jgi:hypothetical protein